MGRPMGPIMDHGGQVQKSAWLYVWVSPTHGALQRKILWAASNYIKPGGVIIYSTCSVEPDENLMVIDAFLKSHSKFSIESAKKYIPEEYVDKNGSMSTYPPDHKIDGGYAVRLKNNG